MIGEKISLQHAIVLNNGNLFFSRVGTFIRKPFDVSWRNKSVLVGFILYWQWHFGFGSVWKTVFCWSCWHSHRMMLLWRKNNFILRKLKAAVKLQKKYLLTLQPNMLKTPQGDCYRKVYFDNLGNKVFLFDCYQAPLFPSNFKASILYHWVKITLCHSCAFSLQISPKFAALFTHLCSFLYLCATPSKCWRVSTQTFHIYICHHLWHLPYLNFLGKLYINAPNKNHFLRVLWHL